MLATLLVAVGTSALPGSIGPGLPAPEIVTREWFNHRPTTLAREEGRVIVLEFWATW